MQSKHPHVHVVKRLDNPNRAKAKTSGPPEIGEDGIVRGGTIRRVSPEMLSTYWEYLTEDYHRVRALADHDMVLVVLEDGHLGDALTTKGLRDVVKAAGKRADLGLLRPHAFRHRWATDMLRSTGNSKMVAEAGGWGSTQTIEDTYAHLVDTPELEAALDRVWRKNPLA
jgi:integrase